MKLYHCGGLSGRGGGRIVDTSMAIRAYAKQAKNKQLEVDATEIRIRAERRVGELMEAQRDTEGLNVGARLVGPGRTRQDDKPTLAEAGIDKHLADRARKLARVPDEQFERKVADWRVRALSGTRLGDRRRSRHGATLAPDCAGKQGGHFS